MGIITLYINILLKWADKNQVQPSKK